MIFFFFLALLQKASRPSSHPPTSNRTRRPFSLHILSIHHRHQPFHPLRSCEAILQSIVVGPAPHNVARCGRTARISAKAERADWVLPLSASYFPGLPVGAKPLEPQRCGFRELPHQTPCKRALPPNSQGLHIQSHSHTRLTGSW